MSIVNLCNNVITNNGSAKTIINDYSPTIQNMVWVETKYIHTMVWQAQVVVTLSRSLNPENTVENSAFTATPNIVRSVWTGIFSSLIKTVAT